MNNQTMVVLGSLYGIKTSILPTVALPLTDAPWTLALLISTLWIIYRVYLVFKKPIEELEEVLGIDIPPIPDVTLSTITSNSVKLYWKPPETNHPPLKHYIQVNGINVVELNRSDTTFTLLNLQPGNYYGIRAIATNTADNSSYSRLIQFQTIPLGGTRAAKLLTDLEHGLGKRPAAGRRTTSHGSITDSLPQQSKPDEARVGELESDETITTLTKRLDALRAEREGIEEELEVESLETEKAKASLTQRRDELKKTVDESERASSEAKKHVNELEKQFKAAQRKKSNKERSLKEKRDTKENILMEANRFSQESVKSQERARNIDEQRLRLVEEHATTLEDIRQKIEQAKAECQGLEQNLRDLGIKYIALEEEKRRVNDEQTQEEQELERREQEEERAHEARIHDLQQQYSSLWQQSQFAEYEQQQAMDRNIQYRNVRSQDPGRYARIPGIDYEASALSHQRSRHGASRASTVSQNSSGYPGISTSLNSISGISQAYNTTPSFFNVNNGMTVHTGAESLGMSHGEVDALTGGAPMSPSANTLLPSDLLRDDEQPSREPFTRLSDVPIATTAIPELPHSFRHPSDGLGPEDPQSPNSIHSRPPSLVASPHESVQNLPNYYSTRDEPNPSDFSPGPSNRSAYLQGTSTTTQPTTKSKFMGLWDGIRKTSASEGPRLGTLKQGQSQSFPLELDSEQDPSSAGRRRIGSGNWAMMRGSSGDNGTGSPSSPSGAVRKPGLWGWGRRVEASSNLLGGLDRANSPRPPSTYSFDNASFPRPSTDSQQIGWAPQFTSPLAQPQSMGPWSRSQSRRPSVQGSGMMSNPHLGSTSNLSIGTTPLEPDEDLARPAPIGTGRIKLKGPKLNPAAPAFMQGMFSSKNEKSTDEEQDKRKGKKAEKRKDGNNNETLSEDTSSPPTSRLSRDAGSIMTSNSLADSHDSFDQASSANNSGDLQLGTSTPKESLMQRLTRKSSSSRFGGVVSWTRANKKANNESNTPGEIDEDEQEGQDYLSKSMDSNTSIGTPPQVEKEKEKSGRTSFQWSRVMGKGKKKAEQTQSETSEAENEEE